MTQDINNSINILGKGGVILYPTDTIWGLGCDATNETAVEKIFRMKKRADEKSMLILLDSPEKLYLYADVPEIAWKLVEISQSPLTIIYPGAKNLAKKLVADDGTIGIRITSDEFCRRLIHEFAKPVVSTSANISGTKPPASFSEISDEIKGSVDYTVKWRQEEIIRKRSSSIIKLEQNGSFKIIRK